MQLNKGLNLDIHPSEVTTGEFRYASNISLDSSFRNPINEKGLRLIAGVTDITTLAGVIPYDKGIIVFANTNYIYNINTQVSPEVIIKSIHIPQIEFLPTKPIRGTYTYNENKDLIIVFSSGVNGNFEDKIINITKCPIEFEASDYYLLDINPNVQFPNITSELTSGTLLSGSYQICISYKIDKEYTNHSLLSLPVYIYGTEEGGDGGRDGLSPNQLTSKGIKYTLNNLDTHYTKYRISVIYNDGTAFIVYDSPDILTSTSEYIIDNLVAFTKSSLDDKLINSIFYSNSESLTIMNNRTYRANLKGHNYGNGFDDVAQSLANKVSLDLKETVLGGSDFSNIKSKQFIKFQNDESYALYLTLGDKKGNILGSYPIQSTNLLSPKLTNYSNTIPNNITTVKEEVNNPYTIVKNHVPNEATITKTPTFQHLGYDIHRSNEYPVEITYSFDEPSGTVTATASETHSSDIDLQFIFTYTNLDNTTSYRFTTITLLANTLSVSKTYTVEEIADYLSDGHVDQIKTIIELQTSVPVLSTKNVIIRFYKDGELIRTETCVFNIGASTVNKEIDLKYYDNYTIEHNIYTIGNYKVRFASPVMTMVTVYIYLNFGMPSVKPMFHIFDIGEQEYTFVDDELNSPTYTIHSIDPDSGALEVSITTPHPVDVQRNITLSVNHGAKFIQIPTVVGSTVSETVIVPYSLDDIITAQSPIDSLNRIRYKYTFDNELLNDATITNSQFNDATLLYNLNTDVYKYDKEVYTNYIAKYLYTGLYWKDINNYNIVTDIPLVYPASIDKYYTVAKENILADGNAVRYTTNYIEISLPDNVQDILGDFYDTIGFWCIHRALRTNTNSKIYSQGIITAQPKIRYDYTRIESGSVAIDLPTALEYTNPQKIDKEDYGAGIYYVGYISDSFDTNGFKEKNDHLNQVRFYSFEDLFNKQDNFPTERLEVISKYDYLMKTPSTSGANNYINQTLYGSTEKIKTLNKNIIKQELHQGNNLSVLNPLLESVRVITLEDSSIYNLPDSDVDNRTKIYRVNSINKISDGYYKYIYNETLVLASRLNRISDLNIEAYGDTFYSEVFLNLKRLFNSNMNLEIFGLDNYVWGIDDITKSYNPEFLKDKVYQFNLRVFIESKYNVHARYWEGDYPEWDQPISTSEQIGYNKVYNLQNTSNITTIVDVNNNEERESNKGEYPSRIIMSKTKSQESNTLNFRKYLALDYYDMPYNRNAIVALNSTYKNLYIQQELALSIASIKDVISYEDGTTYVGSGQLFDRQPTEVIPTGYGFLGCENYFNTGITDLGLWVIDNVQSIIALITDEGINIISNGNNQNWFNNKLRGNNPFINEGCFITYDNSDKQLKRLILTIHQENKTISYIPAIKNWFSFHSYIPRFGVYTRNDTYYFFDRFTSEGVVNKLFKYSNTLKSKFSDLSNINESVLSIYFNEDKGLKKLFQSLYWQTQFILSGTDIYDKTFTKLFVHNDSQCTKEITIGNNVEWFDSDNGVYKEDLWIFNGFEDYVKDNRKPFIDDSINIISSNFNYSKEWFDISKFMSIFAVVTFKFDNWYYSIDGKTKSLQPTVLNIEQPKLILNDVTMAYKKSIR